jgi:hypothetical protein
MAMMKPKATPVKKPATPKPYMPKKKKRVA